MIELLMRRRMMVKSEKAVIPYLCFEALEAGTFTLTIPSNSGIKFTNISYSLNGGDTWVSTAMTEGTGATITTPSVSTGDKVLWKGAGNKFATSTSVYSQFSSSGNFDVSGNVMSLLNGSEISSSMTNTADRIFLHLFAECKIVDASDLILPIVSVGTYGYYQMFDGCSLLTGAPALPATSMGNYGYGYMFRGCSSLTTAPDLLMATVPNYGYRQMFQNCSSLNSIKMTATSINASNSLTNWVSGVASSGTFTKSSSLTLSSGVNGIPNNWTVVDI